MNYYISNSELYHFGIKGQKWGIRRYQNEDGSLTEAGKKRYGDLKGKNLDKYVSDRKGQLTSKNRRELKKMGTDDKSIDEAISKYGNRSKKVKALKTAASIGGAAVGYKAIKRARNTVIDYMAGRDVKMPIFMVKEAAKRHKRDTLIAVGALAGVSIASILGVAGAATVLTKTGSKNSKKRSTPIRTRSEYYSPYEYMTPSSKAIYKSPFMSDYL